MGIQFREHPLEYSLERAMDDRPLKAILPTGAESPRWLYKDKNTRGEWHYEEHRRGHNTSTLQDLWGTAGNEVEFRCSWVASGTSERVWAPPIKVHGGVLGRTRPLLMIQPPDWDQKSYKLVKRDNSAQVRVVYGVKVKVTKREDRAKSFKLVPHVEDFDWRMNPHSLQANPEGGPPYNFVSGEYAHLWRGDPPILLDFWRIREIGDHAVIQHYKAARRGFQIDRPGWDFESSPWIFIDIKFGKDSEKLDARSGVNQAFGCQRVSHNHVNPWKIYKIDPKHMLRIRFFDRLQISEG